ncbi:hypothetical protein CCHR01_03450 [Colletotrichum chrysophilum]|uniref:Uncharacterized protein n=1 Tax=Colletotrichum chrysophilum TaxID=1836956 RepID=A0AAD9AV94_9PEZI|nr:hypothetical protein CCHR01_03450 [Colletotrichum chrysophilum]
MSVAQLTSIRPPTRSEFPASDLQGLISADAGKWLADFAVETPVNGVNNGPDPITLDAEASPSDAYALRTKGQDSTKATLGFPASHPSRQKGLQDIDFPD